MYDKILQSDHHIGYLIQDSLIVFSKCSGRLFGLDCESAAAFLMLYDDCYRYLLDENAKRYPEIPLIFIEQMYDMLFHNDKDEVYSPPRQYGLYEADENEREHYGVNGAQFWIHYPDMQLRAWIHPTLEKLQKSLHQGVNINIDFLPVAERWHIVFNRKIMTKEPLSYERIVLSLHELIRIVSYQSHPYLIAIHAAALKRGEEVVLLPGVSGSGKTTLTAALLKHGYELLSDEVALIDERGYCHPMEMAMPIKEGSWEIIQALGWELESQIHIRWDGQKVRFLSPDKDTSETAKIVRIICPKYTKNGKSKCWGLSPSEILMEIKKGGFQLYAPMDETVFEQLVATIAAVRSYKIEYGSTTEALALIEGLIHE